MADGEDVSIRKISWAFAFSVMAVFCLLMSAVPAAAQGGPDLSPHRIFGIDGSTLLTLDARTMKAVNAVGTDHTPVIGTVKAMAWNRGTLYGVVGAEGSRFDRLITIGHADGVQEDVGSVSLDGEPVTLTGLASESGVLYGLGDHDVLGAVLVMLNTSNGVATLHDRAHSQRSATLGLATGKPDDGRLYYIQQYATPEYNADADFALTAANANPSGITWDGSYFRVTDEADYKVYTYTAGGDYVSTRDFSYFRAPSGGITWTGTKYAIYLRQLGRAYVYSELGAPLDGDNVQIPTHDGRGLAYSPGLYWAASNYPNTNNASYVRATRENGEQVTSSRFELPAANGSVAGMVYDGTNLVVVDNSSDTAYTYTFEGDSITELEFPLTTGNGDPTGIAWTGNSYMVVDSGDRKVYAYLARGTQVIQHTISTKADSVIDLSGPELSEEPRSFAQAGGYWNWWIPGVENPEFQRLTVNPEAPGAVTESLVARADGNITAIADFVEPAASVVLASRNNKPLSTIASGSRELTAVSGMLPGFMFADGQPGRVRSPINVTTTGSSIRFTLRSADGRSMRNPRDAGWLRNRSVELRMSLRNESGTLQTFIQTYNSDPQRFALSGGGWRIDVPNNADWQRFFSVATRQDFRGSILLELVDTCAIPARSYQVNAAVDSWDLSGVYFCAGRPVGFVGGGAQMEFPSYTVAAFEVSGNNPNSYILRAAAGTNAALIPAQVIGDRIPGALAFAGTGKPASVTFLTEGRYYVVIESAVGGAYDATVEFAGPPGRLLFGHAPEGFDARIDPDTPEPSKAIKLQWDPVEGAETYLVRLLLGESSHLVDTGGATAATIPLDRSTSSVLVSVFGVAMVEGGVAYTLDSVALPLRWTTAPVITADIQRQSDNAGAASVRSASQAIFETIGMHEYQGVDADGNPITVDPASDTAGMMVYILLGVGSLAVFALLSIVTGGNVAFGAAGASMVWAGVGGSFFSLHPGVALGPLLIVIVLGALVLIGKLGRG